jgi:hypothetical protein
MSKINYKNFKTIDDYVNFVLNAFKDDPEYKLIESTITLMTYPSSKSDDLFDIQQSCCDSLPSILYEKATALKNRKKKYKDKMNAAAVSLFLTEM